MNNQSYSRGNLHHKISIVTSFVTQQFTMGRVKSSECRCKYNGPWRNCLNHKVCHYCGKDYCANSTKFEVHCTIHDAKTNPNLYAKYGDPTRISTNETRELRKGRRELEDPTYKSNPAHFWLQNSWILKKNGKIQPKANK